MALTRAQLLMGNISDGAILSGQPQGVRPGGAGITISTDGIISVDSQTIVGVMKLGQTPAAAAAAYNGYTWPTGPGAAGQQLETNGAGILNWADADGIDWTQKGQLIVGTGVATDILLDAGAITSLLISDPSSPSGLNYTDAIRTAMQAPAGTTVQRPLSPVAGQIRFNEDSNKFEFYDGTEWVEIASGDPTPGGNTFVVQSIPLSPAETGSALIPFGSTAQRQTVPPPPVGSTRFNTVFQQLEVWNGTTWEQLPGSGIYDFVFQTRPAPGFTASAVIPSGTSIQAEIPGTAGWLRYNTDFNELQLFNGTDWDLIAPSQGAVSSFVQAGTPVARNVGDLWYNTTLQRESVWDGSAWVQPGVTQSSPTGFAPMPFGTTGQRGAGATGGLRLNTDLNQLEFWDGVAWVQVPGSANRDFVEQTRPAVGKTASAIIPPGNSAEEEAGAVGGWLRYNTDFNELQFYNGTDWDLLAPTIGGVSSFVQAGTPVARNTGDFWYNTTLQRESVWDGSAWVQPGVTQTDPAGAALLPGGNDGARPATPSIGMLRYNNNSGTPAPLEFYNGTGWSTIPTTSVSSLTAGTGISVSATTGAVTVTNTGVLSAAAGTGISVSAGTGNVTFGLTNTGVTPGSYSGANITVDAQGRLTAASSSGGSGVTSIIANPGITLPSGGTGNVTIGVDFVSNFGGIGATLYGNPLSGSYSAGSISGGWQAAAAGSGAGVGPSYGGSWRTYGQAQFGGSETKTNTAVRIA